MDITAIQEEHSEFEFDMDAAVRYPVRGEHIPNEEGIAPGWIIENVYVIPGLPAEMRATFERVSGEFSGELQSRVFYSTTSESHLNDLLENVRSRFDVTVGCYPEADLKRIKLSSTDADRLERAAKWITTRPEIETST